MQLDDTNEMQLDDTNEMREANDNIINYCPSPEFFSEDDFDDPESE